MSWKRSSPRKRAMRKTRTEEEKRQAKEDQRKAKLLKRLPATFLRCRAEDAEAEADAEKAIREGKPIPRDDGAQWSYICFLVRSGLCLSVIARHVRYTEDELAMHLQAINPTLAAMSTVDSRYKRAKEIG